MTCLLHFVTSFSTGYIFNSGHNDAVFGAYYLFRFVKDLGLCGMVPICPHVSQLVGVPHDPQLQTVLPDTGYC